MTETPTRVQKKQKGPLKIILVATLLLLVGVFAVLGTNITLAAEELQLITIFNGDSFMEIETDKTIVSDILKEANITIDNNSQRVFPALEEAIETGFITIEDATPITIKADGETLEVLTWADTVEEVLLENEITLDGDILSIPLDEHLLPNQEITIVRVTSDLVHEKVSIPAETTYRNDSSLTLGTEKIHTEPKEGTKKITYEVVYKDGEKVSKTKVKEEVVEDPVNGLVLKGTRAMVSRSGSRTNTQSSNSNTQSSKSNVTEGIASFYGAELHGNNTASGASFDMNALTAAHNTLPFGTRVKVTYLATGRSVVVEINDRGPHVAGRIIDLSRAAAREIGLYSSGVGRVKLEVLD